MNSPIEEGEIADDDYGGGNEAADTSRDNYEHLNMDIETDSENPTKDAMETVNVDDADALRQLLLSQFTRKKTADVSPSDDRRKPADASLHNGGSAVKSGGGEDRRRSTNGTGKKLTRAVSPPRLDRKKNTAPTAAAAVEYTARPPTEEEARDAATGELRTIQRQLRKLQRRLVMARNQKHKILKELDVCEATIICCEREVGDFADAMSDVLRRVLEPIVGNEASDSRCSNDLAPAVDSQSAGRRRSDSLHQRKFSSVGGGVRELLNPDAGGGGHRTRLCGRIQHRMTPFGKPINQLSPDKNFVAPTLPPPTKSSNKNAILDEKLKELELELAMNAQTGEDSTALEDVTNSTGELLEPISMDEEYDDVDIDEEMELVVREELIDDTFEEDAGNETIEEETTLILTPPPPPPTLMEMESPAERALPPDSTQSAAGAMNGDDGPPADSPPDAETRELEILSRLVLRRTQVQVENHQREMAAAAASACRSPSVDVTSDDSRTEVGTTTTEMTPMEQEKYRNQSRLGFWMTRKRARLATASAVDSTTDLPSSMPPIETFCAEEEIQKFKKSISMAKNTDVRPSGYVGRTVVPRPPRNTALQTKAAQRELQNPLIFWHSYRLNQNFPFHLIRHPAVSNKIDPSRPLCPFELHGRCADEKCPWQHSANYRLTDVEIVCDFLRINSLCPPSLTPENYATRLLENYSVEDVARFLASKVPEATRGESVLLPPRAANKNNLSKRPYDEDGRVEYHSSLPHYLSANGMAKVLSE